MRRHVIFIMGKGPLPVRGACFKDFILDQLRDLAQVACRPMFGGHGLYEGRVFFGIIYRGCLYFKTDEKSREQYLKLDAKPFRPSAGQTLKNYYEVPAQIIEDPKRLAAWARRAARCGEGAARLVVHPLTPERWGDLEKLFGARGACGGCWCMWWRVPRSRFEKQKGVVNRRALRRIVDSGDTPGLLAYRDGEPVGWCAVAPRTAYTVLERSRVLKPVDDEPVWSVVCFFVAKGHRGRGVSVKLLQAAVRHARSLGAHVIEGYPVEPRRGRMPDVFAWTGLAGGFREAGFKEVARRSPTRPIMRWPG